MRLTGETTTFHSTVCSAAEFNALRNRLPRASRRRVPRALGGQRGVIVHAVAPGDVLLALRFACIPLDEDPRATIARLETQLREDFG